MPRMMKKYPIADEVKFNRFLVREYLKYGSVDEVFRKNNFDLPVSYANYQRILDRFGVVKAVGPNNKFSEAVDFLAHMVKDNIPFEKLYKKMPPSYRTSVVTLYRILAYVKEGITRRTGCALVITPYNDTRRVVIARDISTPNIEFGKYWGNYTIPMGYAKKGATRLENIKRILQQEVFTQNVIDGKFPDFYTKDDVSPIMYIDIADVRVSVYHFQLPKELSKIVNFSSYKLKDFIFMDAKELLADSANKYALRAGVKEAIGGYLRHLTLLHRNLSINPLQEKSLLNQELATAAVPTES